MLALMLASCSGVNSSQIEISSIVGEKLTIEMDSNPTTGYSWQLPDSAAWYKVVSRDFVAPNNGLVGSPGKESITIKLLEKGKHQLTLEYKRPWEDSPAESTIKYLIEVK